MLTLLQIVQAAQAELGLPQSTTVVNNSDPTTVQMFNLANRVLDTVRRMNRWTVMQFEYNLVVSVPVITTGDVTQNSAVITNIASGTSGLTAQFFMVSGNGIPQAARIQSVDSSTQVTLDMEVTGDSTTGMDITFAQDTYPMPTGFDWFNNRTMWDRTNRWELLGPDSPQLDQWHRSGIVATGPRRHFRQLGPYADRFRIWPPPVEIVNPLQLVFEYLSIAAVLTNGDQAQGYTQFFENDADQPLLDDQAIILGIKWMFWQIKGFNYADMKNDWIDYVKKMIARDGAAGTLNLVQRVNPIFISPANVQDGFFPGPVGPNTGV